MAEGGRGRDAPGRNRPPSPAALHAAAFDALDGTGRERDPTGLARAAVGPRAERPQLVVGQHHTSFHDTEATRLKPPRHRSPERSAVLRGNDPSREGRRRRDESR